MNKTFSEDGSKTQLRTSTLAAKCLALLALPAVSISAFAAPSASIPFKAIPNETTTISASAFPQAAGVGISSPYTGKNGTVTVCDGNILYTPASGFTGNDTFNVTTTNSNGSIGSAVALVTVQPIAPLAIQPNHTVQLQLSGVAGSNYTVQASSDMINWTNIGSVTAGNNGVVLFMDTNAPAFNTRFYRLNTP